MWACFVCENHPIKLQNKAILSAAKDAQGLWRYFTLMLKNSIFKSKFCTFVSAKCSSLGFCWSSLEIYRIVMSNLSIYSVYLQMVFFNVALSRIGQIFIRSVYLEYGIRKGAHFWPNDSTEYSSVRLVYIYFFYFGCSFFKGMYLLKKHSKTFSVTFRRKVTEKRGESGAF